MRGRLLITAATVLFVGASLTTAVRAKDGDKDKQVVNAQEVVVDFGVPGAAGAANHFLVPDEVNVSKGGTVVFRVNGGAHGVSVYSVDKHTVRASVPYEPVATPRSSLLITSSSMRTAIRFSKPVPTRRSSASTTRAECSSGP